MTDWQWTVRGWQHADLATSWLLGVAAYLALVAVCTWITYRWVVAPTFRWAEHRARVHRVRRDNRRSGRTS